MAVICSKCSSLISLNPFVHLCAMLFEVNLSDVSYPRTYNRIYAIYRLYFYLYSYRCQIGAPAFALPLPYLCYSSVHTICIYVTTAIFMLHHIYAKAVCIQSVPYVTTAVFMLQQCAHNLYPMLPLPYLCYSWHCSYLCPNLRIPVMFVRDSGLLNKVQLEQEHLECTSDWQCLM